MSGAQETNINRREAMGVVLGAVSALSVGDVSTAIAQGAREYAALRLASRRPVGLGTDPSLDPAIYKATAAYVERALSHSGGSLTFSDPKYSYEFRVKPQEIERATDFAKVASQVLWRSRDRGGRTGVPAENEIQAAVEKVLSLRARYAETPVGMTVYACDNEHSGRSFGTRAEIEGWNRANSLHGIPRVDGALRYQDEFLKRIEDTPPARTQSGDLLFVCGFNGHGAPGGQGMSMLSDGSSRLSRKLMSGQSIVGAIEKHCANFKDIYSAQADSPNSAYVGLMIFCCFSQDQMRRNGSQSSVGNDVLSRMENLTAHYKIRFYVFTVGETMRPGFYQPGTQIPALGPRAMVRAADHKNGNLLLGDTYTTMGSGGEGIWSNPSLFVTDRTTARMFPLY